MKLRALYENADALNLGGGLHKIAWECPAHGHRELIGGLDYHHGGVGRKIKQLDCPDCKIRALRNFKTAEWRTAWETDKREGIVSMGPSNNPSWGEDINESWAMSHLARRQTQPSAPIQPANRPQNARTVDPYLVTCDYCGGYQHWDSRTNKCKNPQCRSHNTSQKQWVPHYKTPEFQQARQSRTTQAAGSGQESNIQQMNRLEI